MLFISNCLYILPSEVAELYSYKPIVKELLYSLLKCSRLGNVIWVMNCIIIQMLLSGLAFKQFAAIY